MPHAYSMLLRLMPRLPLLPAFTRAIYAAA